MKRKQFLLVGALILATLLVSGIALAQDEGPQSPAAPAEVLTTAFTYQGRLDKDGSPVNDACDMSFRLYDAASMGTEVGTDFHTGVPVNDGLFSVNLDFGADAFNGERRWLEIKVDCEEDGTYADLGLQELTAAPYALGLRPGAVISGANASGSILHVENTTGGIGSAVYAKNNGGYAVHAWSVNNTGVYANSESDYGVDGRSTDSCGVHGESKSSYGVCAAGAGGDLWLHNGDIYAVRESGSDMALYSNDDVYVHLDDDNSNPSKVFSEFQVINANDTAMFSVAENGAVSWYTQTAYVSVAASAFAPAEDGYDYQNRGYSLHPQDTSSTDYYAPLQLPDGATVTKMTFCWRDGSASDGKAYLMRTTLAGSAGTMANVNTSGSTGTADCDDDLTISGAGVDNSQYAYYLKWELPDSNVYGYGVTIEYAYTGPH